jgi:hypothetical protein
MDAYIFYRWTNMGMDFPDLSKLSLKLSLRDDWLNACGRRPDFKSWKNVRGKNKRILLHHYAARADDDVETGGDYLSAYDQMDIDEILERNTYSVEHVVPRSHIYGKNSGPGEDDPIGWVEATRAANSRRSNYPLYLWPNPDGTLAPPNTLVTVDNELHYVPPSEQRGRLARKWLFIRATYTGIQPPSAAQRNRAAEIVALAQYGQIQPAERRVNRDYRRRLGWANPLLEYGAERWYGDAEWLALVFGS